MSTRPPKHRTLASRFTTFTAWLLVWVVAIVLLWDILTHTFSLGEGAMLVSVVLIVAGLVSQFTIRVLTRPLALLQQGITSVRQGRFEPIQVSETHDEIEDLGISFNRMIEELQRSNREIQQHRDLLEERIRQRTEELENAMRTALAASQAKSEFLANMSHELRTPMNGLLGMLDVVLDSSLASEQREHLETAQHSAYSLLALLNDILDLSKIEAGRMMIEKIPFNVRSILEDCVKSYLPRAAQKGIALKFEMDDSSPSQVLGDPLRLRQIVTNLLSNAIKFTERGWVSVSVRTEPVEGRPGIAQFEIDVCDTGTGIDKEKLQSIFDKFTQADGSITRKYGGTGLGLAITKRLTELQDGRVTVESNPGMGSRFSIKLPYEMVREQSPALNAAPVEMAPRAESMVPARILLVEDNVVNQKVVLAVLRKRKYHIDVASDGREALSLMETSRPYDLLLMDVQMPVLDGLETTRIIRKDPRWTTLPILAMTAHAMTGDRERCLQAGMNHYISKPIQPAHLLSTITQALNATSVPVTPEPVRAPSDQNELIGDLLRVFLQLAPARLERLESAALDRDAVAIASEARKIAAAAEQLAASHLGECAMRIEMAGSRGDFSGMRTDLERLRQEIHALEEAIA